MALMNFLGKYGVQTGLGAMAGYEHAGGSDASFVDKAIGTVGGAALGAGMGAGLNKLNHARLSYKASKPGAPQQLQGTGKFIPKMNYTQKGPNFVQTSKPVGHLPASHPTAQQRVANNTLVKRRDITTPPSNAELLKVVKPQELKTMTNMPYNKTWANTGGIAAGIGATGYIANSQSQRNRERIQQKYSDPYQTKHASHSYAAEALYSLNRKDNGMKNVYTQIGLEKLAGVLPALGGGLMGAAGGYYASTHNPESTDLHRLGGTLLGGAAGGLAGAGLSGVSLGRTAMKSNKIRRNVDEIRGKFNAAIEAGDDVAMAKYKTEVDKLNQKAQYLPLRAALGNKSEIAASGLVPAAMVGYGVKKRKEAEKREKSAMLGTVGVGGLAGAAGGYYASGHNPEATGLHRGTAAFLGGLTGAGTGALLGVHGLAGANQTIKKVLKTSKSKAKGGKTKGVDLTEKSTITKTPISKKAVNTLIGRRRDMLGALVPAGAMVGYGAKKRQERKEKGAGLGSSALGSLGGGAAGYYASSHDPESTGLHRFGGTLLGGIAGSAAGGIKPGLRVNKILNNGGSFDDAIASVMKSTKGDYAAAAAVPGLMTAYGMKKRNDRKKK